MRKNGQVLLSCWAGRVATSSHPLMAHQIKALHPLLFTLWQIVENQRWNIFRWNRRSQPLKETVRARQHMCQAKQLIACQTFFQRPTCNKTIIGTSWNHSSANIDTAFSVDITLSKFYRNLHGWRRIRRRNLLQSYMPAWQTICQNRLNSSMIRTQTGVICLRHRIGNRFGRQAGTAWITGPNSFPRPGRKKNYLQKIQGATNLNDFFRAFHTGLLIAILNSALLAGWPLVGSFVVFGWSGFPA